MYLYSRVPLNGSDVLVRRRSRVKRKWPDRGAGNLSANQMCQLKTCQTRSPNEPQVIYIPASDYFKPDIACHQATIAMLIIIIGLASQ